MRRRREALEAAGWPRSLAVATDPRRRRGRAWPASPLVLGAAAVARYGMAVVSATREAPARLFAAFERDSEAKARFLPRMLVDRLGRSSLADVALGDRATAADDGAVRRHPRLDGADRGAVVGRRLRPDRRFLRALGARRARPSRQRRQVSRRRLHGALPAPRRGRARRRARAARRGRGAQPRRARPADRGRHRAAYRTGHLRHCRRRAAHRHDGRLRHRQHDQACRRAFEAAARPHRRDRRRDARGSRPDRTTTRARSAATSARETRTARRLRDRAGTRRAPRRHAAHAGDGPPCAAG